MRGRLSFIKLFLMLALAGCAERGRPRFSDGLLQTSGGLDFGTVALHSRQALEVTVHNVGRTPLTLREVWTVGPSGTYEAQLETPGPIELKSGASSTVRVRYTPRDEADHPGRLIVRTDSRDEELYELELRGRGLSAKARLLTEGIDFGRIEAESEKVMPLTFENPSPIPVEVDPRLVGGDRDEFQLVAGRVTLAPGEKQTLDVRFAPQRVGRKNLALAVAPCDGCVDEIVPVKAVSLEQAVIADPPLVDFGQVPVDRDEVRRGTIRNISTEPMDVTELFLHPTTDPSFTPTRADVPVILQPDEVREYELRYSPGHMGPASGKAALRVANSKRHPTTDVTLQAFGGSSELCVSPRSYDFGNQPIGAKASVLLQVKNCGASNARPLTVESLTVGEDPSLGGHEQFNVGPAALPKTLAAGEGITVKVFFEPSRAGAAGTLISLRTDSSTEPETRLAFRGTAEAHPPCDLRITPGLVDFGTVAPGRGAVLGIKVENRGVDLCAVKNIRLAGDGGGAFSLPGIPLDGLVMPAGNAFSFQVAFRPQRAGPTFGAVQLEPADPANPLVTVPIKANVQASCLVATPPYLDFGMSRPDCSPAPLKVNLENTCTTPVAVRGALIGAGTTDGEFKLTHSPDTYPVNLAPGQTLSLEVGYSAMTAGMNLSPLFIDEVGLDAPLLVTLLGESNDKADQTDRFVQQDGSKVDVLFVVDNTQSMVEEQPRLLQALPRFAELALAKNVDFHFSVTTTGITAGPDASCPGGAQGAEAGRLFPANGSAPRVLSRSTPNLGAALQNNARVGLCSPLEQGFEAMRRALTAPLVDQVDDPRTPIANDGNKGFLREEAALAVVFIGDEDDHSPDDVDTYVRFLQARKGANQPGRATIFAIAPSTDVCDTLGGNGTRYAEAATRTGGAALSICAGDYTPLLESVASKTFGPQDRFPLSALPDPTTLTVTLDGNPAGGWTYDAATNQVVFTQRPSPGARISISYRKACP